MATQSVTDAVVVPQDPGTGFSSSNYDDPVDAASSALMSEYTGSPFVSGLNFQNHDPTNDTVDISPGHCFIIDDSTSTTGNRGSGGNPQVQSSGSSGYDTEIPNNQPYLVIFPTSVTISLSASTLNQVCINLTGVGSNNSVEVRSDGGGGTIAEPSDTYIKIGDVNPDDSTQDSRTNDFGPKPAKSPGAVRTSN